MELNKLFKNGKGFLRYSEMEKGHELEIYVIGDFKGTWTYFKDLESETDLSNHYFEFYQMLTNGKKAMNVYEIFKQSYNRLYDNSNGFYRLKWDDVNTKNLAQAKKLLKVANNYTKALKEGGYNTDYIKTRLYYFINNKHYNIFEHMED